MKRHIVRHGDSFKPGPSGRSKRACVACHASKTKCDGNDRCSRCVKKDIECKYEQQEIDPQDANVMKQRPLALQRTHTQRQAEMSSSLTASSTTVLPKLGHILGPSDSEPSVLSENARLPDSPTSLAGLQISGAGDNIPWILSSTLEKDSPNTDLTLNQDLLHTNTEYLNQISICVIEKHQLYFSYFHHRWPIIHAPTYRENGSNMQTESMEMIGTWLEGTLDSRNSAIAMHFSLVDRIFQQLVSLTDSAASLFILRLHSNQQ